VVVFLCCLVFFRPNVVRTGFRLLDVSNEGGLLGLFPFGDLLFLPQSLSSRVVAAPRRRWYRWSYDSGILFFGEAPVFSNPFGCVEFCRSPPARLGLHFVSSIFLNRQGTLFPVFLRAHYLVSANVAGMACPPLLSSYRCPLLTFSGVSSVHQLSSFRLSHLNLSAWSGFPAL